MALRHKKNERTNRSAGKIGLHLGSSTVCTFIIGFTTLQNFVVSDRKKLEQIREFSYNQSQITDCSHLLVWAAWDSYSADRVGEVLLRTSRERGLPDNTSDEYKKMILDLYEPLGKEWQENRCAKQAYISFGLAIAAAAEQKVDATPMEGFDNAKMDEFLGLTNKDLKVLSFYRLVTEKPKTIGW